MIKQLYGNKSFWQTTARLSLPIIIQNMLVSSFALIDTLMVSQLGDVELSAVGMAGQWSWLLSMTLFGASSGMAIFVSQYWGVRNIKGIHKSITIAMTAALGLSFIFGGLGAFAPRLVISIFNREEAVLAAGTSYIRIAAYSYPAVALSNVFYAALRSTEHVNLPMYVSLFTTVANGFFNYALIFGKFGMPEMGIAGAALATCISAWAGPVIVIVVSLIEKNILAYSPLNIFDITKEDIKAFLSKALPVAANESLWGLGTIAFNIIYSNMGHEYYAAVTIFRTFEELSFVFFIGMCNACAIMVGKQIGCGRIKDAVTDAKRFAVLEPAVALILGVIIIIFRNPLVHIFNLTGKIPESTVSLAVIIMCIYAVEMPLRNLPYIQIVGFFRAGGDASTATKYDVGCLWLFSLPVTILSTYVFKLPFPVIFALMYVCEDVPKSVLCVKHFISGKWIKPVTKEGVEGMKVYIEEQGSQRIL